MSKGYSATQTESVQSAIKQLTRFLRKCETVPNQELEVAAERIKAKAIARTPYKTGKLERSVYVTVSKSKSKPGLRAGASARSKHGYNYAGIQHENEDFHHPIKGEDHYISGPFNEEISAMQARVLEKLHLD